MPNELLPWHVEMAILALCELEPYQFGIERADYDEAVRVFDALLESMTADIGARAEVSNVKNPDCH